MTRKLRKSKLSPAFDESGKLHKGKGSEGSPNIDIKAPGVPPEEKRQVTKRLAKIKSIEISSTPVMTLKMLVHLEGARGDVYDICMLPIDEFNSDESDRIGTVYGCELLRLLAQVFGGTSEAKGQYIYALTEKPKGFIGFTTLDLDGIVNGIIWQDVKDNLNKTNGEDNDKEG